MPLTGARRASLLLLGVVLVPLAALGRHPRVVEGLGAHRALRQDLDEVAVRVLVRARARVRVRVRKR